MNATGSAAYIAPELSSIKDVGLKLDWMLLGNAYYEPQTIAAIKTSPEPVADRTSTSATCRSR